MSLKLRFAVMFLPVFLAGCGKYEIQVPVTFQLGRQLGDANSATATFDCRVPQLLLTAVVPPVSRRDFPLVAFSDINAVAAASSGAEALRSEPITLPFIKGALAFFEVAGVIYYDSNNAACAQEFGNTIATFEYPYYNFLVHGVTPLLKMGDAPEIPVEATVAATPILASSNLASDFVGTSKFVQASVDWTAAIGGCGGLQHKIDMHVHPGDIHIGTHVGNCADITGDHILGPLFPFKDYVAQYTIQNVGCKRFKFSTTGEATQPLQLTWNNGEACI